MIDAKKFITGFLILALGASTAAWVLSDNGAGVSSSTPSASTAGPTAPTPENAFLNPTSTVPSDIVALLSGELPSSTAVALNNPNNLTASIGNSLLDGLIASNPNGIQTDSGGNEQVNMPDEQNILSAIAQSQPGQDIHIPDWDIEVAQDQAKIKRTTQSSLQQEADYLTSLQNINNQYFASTGLIQTAELASTTDSSNISPDPSILITAGSAASGALASSMQLQVPASLIPLQKAWIRMLVYEKNIAGMFNSDPSDPARTVLALQAEENNYNLASNKFTLAIEKISSGQTLTIRDQNSNKRDTGFLALVNGFNLFRVSTAFAQTPPAMVPTLDTANTAATVGEQVKTWSVYLLKVAKDIGLQILINTVVAQVQSRIVGWIQNSGAPLFVQNWADQYANAGILSAQNYIANDFSCVNSSIFPQIQAILNLTYKSINGNACQAQFNSQLGAGGLSAFYNNFSNGGFLSFGETLMPTNDFYGGLFFTAQGAEQAAGQSKNVLGIKINSEKGMVGVQTCADGSNPNGSHYVCDAGYTLQGTQCIDPKDPTAIPLNATQEMNLGSCPDGSTPKTMSPAEATTELLGGAIKLTGLQITNPKSTTGILTALASSLVMQLANQVITYTSGKINNAINTGIMSINAGSITAASSTVSILSCDPTNTSVSVGVAATLSANGGFDSSGNLPSYLWSSSDGQTGAGSLFSPVYNAPGKYTVSLTDSNNDPAATCFVAVAATSTATQTGNIICSPATQIMSLTSTTSANFTAQGGSGTSYVWSAPGSVSTNGSSTAAFTATYHAAGIYTVSVFDAATNSSSTCDVTVQP